MPLSPSKASALRSKSHSQLLNNDPGINLRQSAELKAYGYVLLLMYRGCQGGAFSVDVMLTARKVSVRTWKVSSETIHSKNHIICAL